MRCPACSAEARDDGRFCSRCGAELSASVDPTRTSAGVRAVPSAPFDRGRFLPGVVVADRYRIYGLLGRGGMGEVYRADDLKLGQIVALKFLPKDVENDEARRARFLDEVRIARQVSHSSVCRVYDIGDVDGRHFLSMEFVDGEDLATLLRRIGRLPKDKAVQIARQLCAGLAAAHEQKVLHRDLKPANVMIDGRGNARITDFGLAEFAWGATGSSDGGGTPAYMAPELLAGGAASVKSDVYALGLVLYELFTGHQPFPPGATEPASPSSHVEGLDPAVERVLLRCLSRDPRGRPASALSVAAALPGGDPLAAALAAGETPSPELVAEAGGVGALNPAVAWSIAAAIVLGTLLSIALAPGTQVLRLVPLPKPPEVLADRARTVVRELGYVDPPADTVTGFGYDAAHVGHIAEHDQAPSRWGRLTTERPTAFTFWYRQGPEPLRAIDHGFPVTPEDPPPYQPGMLSLTLDTSGRLEGLMAVPSDHDEGAAPATEPDWPRVLAETGLDPSKLQAVTPEWAPPVVVDRRAAWTGTYEGQPDAPVRLEAASYRGRPVWLRTIHPWTRPAGATSGETSVLVRTAALSVTTLAVAILVAGVFLARRNLRLGRGDRKGALRIGLTVFALGAVTILLQRHYVFAASEVGDVIAVLGFPLLLGSIVGLFYLALEPHLRRYWPAMLISWMRLLDGRFGDPLVGRDVALGVLAGVAIRLWIAGYQLVTEALGARAIPGDTFAGPPLNQILKALNGTRFAVGNLTGIWTVSLLVSLGLLVLLLLCRFIGRRTWVGIGLFLLVTALPGLPPGVDLVPFLIQSLIYGGIFIAFLFRYGLVAALTSQTVSAWLLSYPLTFQTSSWYFGTSLFALAAVAGLTVYGLRVALSGVPREAENTSLGGSVAVR